MDVDGSVTRLFWRVVVLWLVLNRGEWNEIACIFLECAKLNSNDQGFGWARKWAR